MATQYDMRTTAGSAGNGLNYTTLSAETLSGVPGAVFTYARLRCSATVASGSFVRVADPHVTPAADSSTQIVTGQQWSAELHWPFGAQVAELSVKGSGAAIGYELVYSVAAPT